MSLLQQQCIFSCIIIKKTELYKLTNSMEMRTIILWLFTQAACKVPLTTVDHSTFAVRPSLA